MPRVCTIRAVNVPVADEESCLAFYRDRLGMEPRHDVLPDGTMCRWDRDHDQFLGLRPSDRASGRGRYPYGRCADWDHAELVLNERPPDVSPVETRPGALVLADPEDRALEALLDHGGRAEVPGIAAVGLSVVETERTRSFYDRLGFARRDADGTPDAGRVENSDAEWVEDEDSNAGGNRVVYRAESGQRWVLVPGDRPGLHHVTFRLEPARFRRIADRLSDHRRVEGDRIRVRDPEGRRLVFVRD